MQKLTVEELKRLLYDTFCDHLSMKDIENIIMTEENHIENPEDCQLDIDSKEPAYTTTLGSLVTVLLRLFQSIYHILEVSPIAGWVFIPLIYTFERLVPRCHFLNPQLQTFPFGSLLCVTSLQGTRDKQA